MKMEDGETIPTAAKRIGTVTFIKEDSYEFVALGHSTLHSDSSNLKKTYIKGSCYDVNLEGIEKGKRNEVGGIVASLETDKEIGNIYYDSSYGIFGEMNYIKDDYQEVETACWYDVRKGKANILANVDGKGLKSYDIEITGINYINGNKNIEVKITDKELIAKTGGIVQGMSGTPVMQNRKTYRGNKLCYTRKPDDSICHICRQTSIKIMHIVLAKRVKTWYTYNIF